MIAACVSPSLALPSVFSSCRPSRSCRPAGLGGRRPASPGAPGAAPKLAVAGLGPGRLPGGRIRLAAWRAELRLADELPAAWEGRDVEVVGVVAALPQDFSRGSRFEFDVETILTAGAVVPDRLMLSWYRGPAPAR